MVALVFLGAAWYFSGLILDGATIDGDTGGYTNEVTAIDGSTVTCTVNDAEIEDPATDVYTNVHTGLRFENGAYLQLAPAATTEGRSITREYELVGDAMPAVGDSGKFD